jgi:C1A family cysteine protease
MNKILLALTVIGSIAVSAGVYNLASTQAAPHPSHIMDAWAQWKKTHTKLYAGVAQEGSRLDAFAANFNQIQASNANPAHTFKLGFNQFSDMTNEEFTRTYLRDNSSAQSPDVDSIQLLETPTAPDSVDWSAEGAVSQIKDQGQCGSCWAFSTTGALEGLDFLTNGKIRLFSEQQLVDCDKGSLIPFYLPNMGCSGGNMGWAFSYARARGMMSEADYPYVSPAASKCAYDASKTLFAPKSYHSVMPLCNSCLKSHVAVQPVSVAIDGSSIQHYISGVYNGSCSFMTNHGVLAVGYGTENGATFWKIKNSWGAAWGEAGFLRISRSDSIGTGMCGIATRASYPTM